MQEITFNELPEAVSRLFEKLTCIEQLLKDRPVQAPLLTDPAPMSISQAAIFLQLSTQTLYQKVSRHELRHYKVGNRLYFLREDLNAYILSGRRLNEAEITSEAAVHLLKLKINRA